MHIEPFLLQRGHIFSYSSFVIIGCFLSLHWVLRMWHIELSCYLSIRENTFSPIHLLLLLVVFVFALGYSNVTHRTFLLQREHIFSFSSFVIIGCFVFALGSQRVVIPWFAWPTCWREMLWKDFFCIVKNCILYIAYLTEIRLKLQYLLKSIFTLAIFIRFVQTVVASWSLKP